MECNKKILKGKNKNENILVVDIETTGLDPSFHMICEVGICVLNLATGETDPVVNCVIQEEHKRFSDHAWVFQNSDLDAAEVKKATYFKEIRGDLQEIFDAGFKATAYNSKFDFGFLEERGIRIENKFADMMYALKDVLKIPHWKYGYKLPSVQESWDFLFGRDGYIEAHRALDDCIHEAKIVFESFKRGYIESYIEERKELIKIYEKMHTGI